MRVFRHNRRAPGGFCLRNNLFIADCNIPSRHACRHATALVHMFDHGQTINLGQWLSRKAVRAHARRHPAQNIHRPSSISRRLTKTGRPVRYILESTVISRNTSIFSGREREQKRDPARLTSQMIAQGVTDPESIARQIVCPSKEQRTLR